MMMESVSKPRLLSTWIYDILEDECYRPHRLPSREPRNSSRSSLWDCELDLHLCSGYSENSVTWETNTYFAELLWYRLEPKLGLLWSFKFFVVWKTWFRGKKSLTMTLWEHLWNVKIFLMLGWEEGREGMNYGSYKKQISVALNLI